VRAENSFHIFKDASAPRLAVCGYIAKSEPKTSRDPFPKCPECMEWFKNLCWKKEESK
jgi:hypothetical protein